MLPKLLQNENMLRKRKTYRLRLDREVSVDLLSRTRDVTYDRVALRERYISHSERFGRDGDLGPMEITCYWKAFVGGGDSGCG